MSKEDILDCEILRTGSDSEANHVLKKWANNRVFVKHLLFLVRDTREPKSDFSDLRQNTLIAFWANIRGGFFRGECGLKTLLFSIANRRWADMQRARQRFVPIDTHKMPEPSGEMILGFISSEERLLLTEVLEKWDGKDSRCLQLFNLRFTENHAFEAIDENFGDAPGNGRKRFHDCLNRLRKWLKTQPQILSAFEDIFKK